MLDFLFALIAAGVNGADGPPADHNAAQADAPAAIVAPAPATLAEASPASTAATPTASTTVTGQTTPAPDAPTTPAKPQSALPDPATAPADMNMSVVPPGLVAEPQTPGGRFTTATEVKPILNATRGSWVAVREYEGKDYLYVTHLWGWRCGLAAMAISVNDEPMQNWPLPPCHTEYATPNAILEEDGVPMLTMRPGSVQRVRIQIVYDDLTMDAASFERGSVLIP